MATTTTTTATVTTTDNTGEQKPNLDAYKAHLKEEGWCVIPDLLDAEKLKEVNEKLWWARDESERRGDKTYLDWLDPNASNVRIFYLPELHAIFREMLAHPTAIEMVKSVFGSNFLISNFTANIARPGSKSMGLHSDQSLMCPNPWLEPWNLNVIWCLSDLYFENGATVFIPRSHNWTTTADIPEEPEKLLQPFVAKAGSVVVMDGRLWHTSGANITKDVDRPLLFASYNTPFLRPQVNWAAGLSAETKADLSDDMREWMGVNRDANLGVVRGVNDVFTM
ncbi:hypothetical protein B7463_g11891, partial [Scytalidium lignicola]